mmetsp:Transcript_18854/g.71858  ORF Transcript_18854/g.71858 Transcript_18854/m.71858 type:complete len:340 (-) Transcript_18854:241-1260(-)
MASARAGKASWHSSRFTCAARSAPRWGANSRSDTTSLTVGDASAPTPTSGTTPTGVVDSSQRKGVPRASPRASGPSCHGNSARIASMSLMWRVGPRRPSSTGSKASCLSWRESSPRAVRSHATALSCSMDAPPLWSAAVLPGARESAGLPTKGAKGLRTLPSASTPRRRNHAFGSSLSARATSHGSRSRRGQSGLVAALLRHGSRARDACRTTSCRPAACAPPSPIPRPCGCPDATSPSLCSGAAMRACASRAGRRGSGSRPSAATWLGREARISSIQAGVALASSPLSAATKMTSTAVMGRCGPLAVPETRLAPNVADSSCSDSGRTPPSSVWAPCTT